MRDLPVHLPETGRSHAFRHFFTRLVREKRLGAVGAVILLMLLFSGLFAGVLAPYGMSEIHLIDRMAPPSPKYLLGADQLGRDILSRMIFGARVSLIVGLAGTTVNVSRRHRAGWC